MDMNTLREQVLHNCTISDSHHSGLYSVCGLALRLRDLYKWEKGLDPWVERESSELLEWIGDKEEQWELAAEENFRDIVIDGEVFDPLDLSGINAKIEPHGLFYGGGFVQSMKPTFFLAVLEEKRKVKGHNIYILGEELARDLMTIPALSQENNVFLRKESARRFLWDKILFLKQSGKEALRFGLETYGVDDKDPDSLRQNLERISTAELETYLYHEIGEMQDRVFDRGLWREIVSRFPYTPIELLSRTIKDLIADTGPHGALRHIIQERKNASLSFYVAFLDGMRKELFPEISEAFQSFMKVGHWGVVERAVSRGYGTARKNAEALVRIFEEGKEKGDMAWTEREIERRLLAPLGIGKNKDSAS